MSADPLLTTLDVARWLAVSEKTVRRYVQNGMLQTVRLPGSNRFERSEVELFIDLRRERRAWDADLTTEDIAILNEDKSE